MRQPRQDIVSPPSPAVRRSRPLYDYDDELDRPSIWRELPEDDDLSGDMSVGSHNPMHTTLDTMETSSPATTVTMDYDLPMALDDSMSTESLLSHRLREHKRFYQLLRLGSHWLTMRSEYVFFGSLCLMSLMII